MNILLRLLCLIPFFQLCWISIAASEQTITLAADPWCPYNCEADSSSPGILIEIATEAFEAEGYTVNYTEMPWARAIKAVRNGLIDGLVGTGREETPDFVFPDAPLAQAEHTFYVRKDDNWFYQGLESLKNRSLGVINGYSYGDLQTRYIAPNASNSENISVISGTAPLKRMYQMLIGQRIDTLIEDRLVFLYSLKGLLNKNPVRPAGVYATEDIYIAFTPDGENSKKYAQILSDFIAKNEGAEVRRILLKYTQ
ncbi:substrate-binding periplasmic protein [Sneathiella glossodoripedis]|uniref:substrate-binding periplasmic protein n=1 Tax=Sneathiella glossodoripedis TaxID=418853 RepID=UPI0004706797|nr:transporter substrate-binding domain-containing protein [Sneathiella glossodoripedis]